MLHLYLGPQTSAACRDRWMLQLGHLGGTRVGLPADSEADWAASPTPVSGPPNACAHSMLLKSLR